MTPALSGMRQIAERTGVSLSTVYYVLSGAKPVSEKLRRQVTRAAKDLRYDYKSVRRRRRPAVVAVCAQYGPLSDEIPPFNAEVCMSLLRAADESGLDLLVLGGTRSPAGKSSSDAYLARYFDALIAWNVTAEQEKLLARVARERPVVVLFRSQCQGDVRCVTPNNEAIGQAAAEELLSCHYDRYIHVAGDTADAVQRRQGFEAAIGARGNHLLLRTIEPMPGESTWQKPYAERAGEKIRSYLRRGRTLGVYAWCDPLGVHLVRWLDQAPRRVPIPKSVGVVGTDGLDLGRPLLDEVALSTVTQGIQSVAREAIQFAKDLVAGPCTERVRMTGDVPQVARRWSTSAHQDHPEDVR